MSTHLLPWISHVQPSLVDKQNMSPKGAGAHAHCKVCISDWVSRATSSKYDSSQTCPSGWRLHCSSLSCLAFPGPERLSEASVELPVELSLPSSALSERQSVSSWSLAAKNNALNWDISCFKCCCKAKLSYSSFAYCAASYAPWRS